MQISGLDESQAGIKISGRNINNLSYADDTILIEENEEELKSLLIRMKDSSLFCNSVLLCLKLQSAMSLNLQMVFWF